MVVSHRPVSRLRHPLCTELLYLEQFADESKADAAALQFLVENEGPAGASSAHLSSLLAQAGEFRAVLSLNRILLIGRDLQVSSTRTRTRP